MASKPVRVPEETYEKVREVAVKLDVPLSRATEIVLETGLDHFRLQEHLTLDPDLQDEMGQALFEAGSDTEMADIDRQITQRQIERNRERSELTEPAQ